ncbi:MAG: hypothetical protein ACK4ZJ_18780, partial [Allorhizobium sp.]
CVIARLDLDKARAPPLSPPQPALTRSVCAQVVTPIEICGGLEALPELPAALRLPLLAPLEPTPARSVFLLSTPLQTYWVRGGVAGGIGRRGGCRAGA